MVEQRAEAGLFRAWSYSAWPYSTLISRSPAQETGGTVRVSGVAGRCIRGGRRYDSTVHVMVLTSVGSLPAREGRLGGEVQG